MFYCRRQSRVDWGGGTVVAAGGGGGVWARSPSDSVQMMTINFYGCGSISLIHCRIASPLIEHLISRNGSSPRRAAAVDGDRFVVLVVRLVLMVDGFFVDYRPNRFYSVIWWSRTRALNSLWPGRNDSNQGTRLLSPLHRDCDPFSVVFNFVSARLNKRAKQKREQKNDKLSSQSVFGRV